jgi:septum formation protein
MEQIILASASPRRQGFFRLLGLPFSCIPAQIDETPLAGLSPRQVAEDLALRKTMAVVAKLGQDDAGTPTAQWVFGADTIVVLDGEIFGKAADRNVAKIMLERLAGRRHEVITAMALYNRCQKTSVCRSNTSEVVFAPLGEAEIEWYLDTGEWEGAAGSYRLQDRGGCLIESINGSPSGVAGLPLHDFYVMLKDNGYTLAPSGIA